MATHLAGAGVGRLGIIDDGVVATGDPATQPLHFAPDVGVPKAHSAAVKPRYLNPAIVVEPYQVRLDRGNADGLIAGADLVVDCSGDPGVSTLLGRSCRDAGMPLVTGVCGKGDGHVLATMPGVAGCVDCVGAPGVAAGGQAEEPAVSWAGPLAGMVGSLQALIALDLLCGRSGVIAGAWIDVDPWGGTRWRAAVRQMPCPHCDDR